MTFRKTFHGYIEHTRDILLLIEACRNHILPTINRRLIDKERSAIKSGTIIIFNESESGIKRWTDGFLWSPSRILGNFLVYRELANRENRRIIINDEYSLLSTTYQNQGPEEDESLSEQQNERQLVGSLTTASTSYNFKKNGLIKKTIRIMVDRQYLHVVSYYNKYDVLNHILPTPSTSPQLAGLQISPDLMPHLQGLYHRSSNSASMNPSRNNNLTSLPLPLPPLPDIDNIINNRKRSKSSSSSSSSSIVSLSSDTDKVFYKQPKLYDGRYVLPSISYYQYETMTTAKAPDYVANNRRKHYPTTIAMLSPSPSPTLSSSVQQQTSSAMYPLIYQRSSLDNYQQ